jgi:hypothetical protein
LTLEVNLNLSISWFVRSCLVLAVVDVVVEAVAVLAAVVVPEAVVVGTST